MFERIGEEGTAPVGRDDRTRRDWLGLALIGGAGATLSALAPPAALGQTAQPRRGSTTRESGMDRARERARNPFRVVGRNMPESVDYEEARRHASGTRKAGLDRAAARPASPACGQGRASAELIRNRDDKPRTSKGVREEKPPVAQSRRLRLLPLCCLRPIRRLHCVHGSDLRRLPPYLHR
jgi:hypothetical protein